MIYLCAGLMRTGSVACWQVMGEIAKLSDGKAPPLGTNFLDPSKLEAWGKAEYPVVIKLHRYDKALDDVVAKQQVRAIITIRDYRDVVVSLMNFRQQDFTGVMASRAFSGNMDAYFEWAEKMKKNIFCLRYEELMADRPFVIRAIGKAMGVRLTAERSKKIDKKFGIPANKRRAAANHTPSSPNFMSHRHIHSGAVGQYKNVLTPAQIAIVEEKAGGWLRATGYM